MNAPGAPQPEKRPDPLTSATWPEPGYIVTFCNQKGGVGKSIAVIGIAAMAAARGVSTLVVDTDPQGTAAKVSRIFRDHALEEGLPGPGYQFTENPETSPGTLGRLRDVPDFGLIMVDTPGNLTSTDILEQVLRWSDLAVIPSDFTALSAGETVETAGYAARNGCPSRVLLNMMEARFSVEAEARQLLAARGLACFGQRITRHKVHANAARDRIPISQYPGPVAAAVRGELNGVLEEMLAARPRLLAQLAPAVTTAAAE